MCLLVCVVYWQGEQTGVFLLDCSFKKLLYSQKERKKILGLSFVCVLVFSPGVGEKRCSRLEERNRVCPPLETRSLLKFAVESLLKELGN